MLLLAVISEALASCKPPKMNFLFCAVVWVIHRLDNICSCSHPPSDIAFHSSCAFSSPLVLLLILLFLIFVLMLYVSGGVRTRLFSQYLTVLCNFHVITTHLEPNLTLAFTLSKVQVFCFTSGGRKCV